MQRMLTRLAVRRGYAARNGNRARRADTRLPQVLWLIANGIPQLCPCAHTTPTESVRVRMRPQHTAAGAVMPNLFVRRPTTATIMPSSVRAGAQTTQRMRTRSRYDGRH